MSWRDAFLYLRRDQGRSSPAKTPARAVGLETFAVSERARDDAGALGLHADPDETIFAEMAVMAARAAERAREEELDNDRVAMMVPRHRLEYRRMRWEAINAVKLSGMSPQRIEQEYDAFRLAQWEQQNAERIAPMSPGERQGMFRSEELLTRYRAGLPARDAAEREAYHEWRQLDADVVDAYQEDATIPGPPSGAAVGELSPESPAAEMSPRYGKCAARSRGCGKWPGRWAHEPACTGSCRSTRQRRRGRRTATDDPTRSTRSTVASTWWSPT